METNLKKLLPLLFFCLLLFSCRNTLSFTLMDDESIYFEADCNFDAASPIQKMLESTGSSFDDLNLDELKSGLEEEGFSKVQVYKKKEGGLTVKGILPDDNVIVGQENGSISFRLTPENFRDFYNGSGERLASVFDIFLIPLLSDDEEISGLDRQGYLDLIASFYGQGFSDEIAKSSLVIILKNKKQNRLQKSIYFPDLFTITSAIDFSL